MSLDIIFPFIGFILVIAGIIGCFLPSIPGPPLNFAALIMLKFYDSESFSIMFLVVWGIITLVVTILDYVLPVMGAKFYGASKYGIWGSVIGMIIGLFFFPPFGMIAGVFIGAVLGEFLAGQENSKALRAGFGTFIISVSMIVVKFALSAVMSFYFIYYFIEKL